MTIKEAARKLKWTELFLREAIDKEKVDFGICVRMPGSRRRTFKINEKKLEAFIRGEA